jgi:hypothetical protein
LDGFSEPFATCVRWGSLFYIFLGMFFLRKFLLLYFNETVTGLTLLVSVFGSLVFYYGFGQSELTHGYLFCLFSIFMYLIYKWHQAQKFKYTVFIGFIIGLISLIRPTEVFMFIFFLFWNVRNWTELKAKFYFFRRNYLHIIVIAIIAGVLWIPQLVFYKIHTGNYFYFSYMRERFFWNDPQIINILFSYRKGWITYTPLAALAIIGFFFVKKEFPLSKWTFLVVTALITYVYSCWWDWGYGGCFGARSFCQSIAWLSVPLAYVIQYVLYPSRKNVLRGIATLIMVVFLFSCICLNIEQSYQAEHDRIHPWAMTKKSYWSVFRKFKYKDDFMYQYWGELKEPDFIKLSDGSDRDQAESIFE